MLEGSFDVPVRLLLKKKKKTGEAGEGWINRFAMHQKSPLKDDLHVAEHHASMSQPIGRETSLTAIKSKVAKISPAANL